MLFTRMTASTIGEIAGTQALNYDPTNGEMRETTDKNGGMFHLIVPVASQ